MLHGRRRLSAGGRLARPLAAHAHVSPGPHPAHVPSAAAAGPRAVVVHAKLLFVVVVRVLVRAALPLATAPSTTAATPALALAGGRSVVI